LQVPCSALSPFQESSLFRWKSPFVDINPYIWYSSLRIWPMNIQLWPGPAIATHLTFLSTQAEHQLWKTCSGTEDRDWGVYYTTDKLFTYLTRSGEEIQEEERQGVYLFAKSGA
jgi:hypothetical protein